MGGFLFLIFIFVVLIFVYLIVRKTTSKMDGKDESMTMYIKEIKEIFEQVEYVEFLKGIDYGGLIALIIMILTVFTPIIIFGYQIVIYLKNGFWQSMSIIDVLQYYGMQWAIRPNDWIGLWKIFNIINISIPISLFFFCTLVAMYQSNIRK